MIHILLFALSLAGFIALLLAMPRHQQDWLRRKLAPSQSRALRAVGLILLALAFVGAGVGLGWAYGAVTWFGWLTMAAATVVTLHTNRERLLRKVRP